MRKPTSAAEARWDLRATWAEIDELDLIYSGCDWCCGGGDEHMSRLGKKAAALKAWLRDHGFSIPVHPGDCPALSAQFHEWADACDAFQDGWIGWYETNKKIERSIRGVQV